MAGNPPPRDWDEQTDEELAALDFEGIAEFRSDGVGCGTPEFREQLEAYFKVIAVATRHAIAILSLSRDKLTEGAAALKLGPNKEDDGAAAIGKLLVDGREYALTLARCIRAAEVRQICAIVLRDMEAEDEDEPPAVAGEA